MNRSEKNLESLLGGVRERAWPGPDRCERVETALKESIMSANRSFVPTRSAVILVVAGALAGGAVASVATHQVMSKRVLVKTHTGEMFELEFPEGVDVGNAGEFVTQDGNSYKFDVVGGAANEPVTSEDDSPEQTPED